MGLFLIGSDVAIYLVVGDITVLGNLVSVNEETRVCSLDISDYLE